MLKVLLLFISVHGMGASFYVATNGSDSAAGSLSAPFKTLEKARSAVQALNGTIGSQPYTVNILGGTYRVISNPSFYLHWFDSGSPANPITYQAMTNADVHVSGGLAVTNWVALANADGLARIPAAAQSHVYQANLSSFPAFIAQAAYGTQIGDAFIHQNELFWNGHPMTVAQYPNGTNWLHVGTIGSSANIFGYTNANTSTWTNRQDIIAGGFFKFDYLHEGYLMTNINTGAQQVSVAIPSAGWQAPVVGARYKFINVLEELDSAGEYYLDRVQKIAYFWPPDPIASGTATISEVNGSVLNLNGATNVIFKGITFEDSAEWGMVMQNAANITFDHCTNRNAASYNFYSATASTNITFTSCEISGAGQYGISIAGGDRTSLTSGRHSISNSLIHDCGRLNLDCRGIYLSAGVGTYIGHNIFYNIPAAAISYSGNNHRIEYNEFYNVCNATSDSGAVYGGAHWTYGGNVIQCNYFHDIQPGNGLAVGPTTGFNIGVYLDDALSGVTVNSNCFDRVYWGIEMGGGRNNGFTNNMFVDCTANCVQADQRLTVDGALYSAVQSDLSSQPYTTPPWSTQYPWMSTILSDNPTLAVHDFAVNGLKYQGSNWLTWFYGAQTNFVEINSFTNGDPQFVDYAHDNFRLQPTSPALAAGFHQIPFDLIGPLPKGLAPVTPTNLHIVKR